MPLQYKTPCAALLLGLIALAGPAPTLADTDPGEGPATERVLLVGDSWAQFMWGNRTLRDVFADNGRPDIVEEGAVTAIAGTTASEWAQPSFLQSITDELDTHPDVDIVQLTVGGNDFLEGQPGGGWYVGIPAGDLDALTAQILADTTTVIDHVLARGPSIQILVSLYDYSNFVSGSGLFGCPARWTDLGQPTPRQLNEALIAFQASITALVDSNPRISLVDHAGLMQFTFGFPADGIQPGDLLPPGDLDRPSPTESMFLGLDCIHLSSDGYYAVGQNLWQGFYDSHFNGTLFEDGFESGDVLSWTLSVP